MEDFTKIFQALSDSNRIKILKMLEVRPICVCEFPDILELSVSTVSSHLSFLKKTGFITSKQNGKWIEYSLNKNSENPIIQNLLTMTNQYLNDNPTIKNDKDKISKKEIKCCY